MSRPKGCTVLLFFRLWARDHRRTPLVATPVACFPVLHYHFGPPNHAF